MHCQAEVSSWGETYILIINIIPGYNLNSWKLPGPFSYEWPRYEAMVQQPGTFSLERFLMPPVLAVPIPFLGSVTTFSRWIGWWFSHMLFQSCLHLAWRPRHRYKGYCCLRWCTNAPLTLVNIEWKIYEDYSDIEFPKSTADALSHVSNHQQWSFLFFLLLFMLLQFSSCVDSAETLWVNLAE